LEKQAFLGKIRVLIVEEKTMNSHYKISRISILGLVLLLPIFFIPSLLLPIGVAKSALLTLGTIIAFLAFVVDTLRSGKLSLPSHPVLWGTLLLPVVYFLSSIFGSSSSLSLFGYSFEVGTFVFILLVSVLFFITASVITNLTEVFQVYGALIISLSLLAVFAFIKILSGGNWLVLNTFSGNMSNPIGAWTDYAMGFSLLAVLSLLALTMLSLSKITRIFMNVIFVLSIVLMAIINFSVAWTAVLVFSLVLLVYLLTVEKSSADLEKSKINKKIWPAIVLFAVSLLFTINPVVSSTQGNIGNVISGVFKIENTDIRPSFMTTLSVAKSTLLKKPVLGSGPASFQRDWLQYKPQSINASVFWNTPFQFGAGFVPTQVAETGIVGTLAWIFFFVCFLLLGWKALVRSPEDKNARFALISSFVSSLFLWIVCFLYIPSIVILVLTFIFTGLFVGVCRIVEVVSSKELMFADKVIINFVFVLLSIVLVIGAVTLGFVSYQKTLSVVHFEKALVLSNTANTSPDQIAAEIGKAINLSPSDTYYNALYQINFARAQSVSQKTTGDQEANKKEFQTAISNSIAAAQNATNVAPGNYQNWIILGSLYESLMPEPISLTGAYDAAKNAYNEAKKRNPESPEPILLLARLEYTNKNIDGARTLVEQALEKKQDYADAYFLLTQIEAGANNLDKAIAAAESGAILSPDNAGIFFELGLLKYTKKDYTGAVEALNKALGIVPNYANAQYFLGLSLEAQKKHDEAIAQFEILAKNNPENQDILSVLANLKANRDPFYKSPNGSTKPENRPAPPITSQQ